MTIQECYSAFGGDYADVKERLCSDALIRRFIGRFLSDDSYVMLCRAMEAGQCADAFRAAHTLKGVSANLSMTGLCASAGRLTELLRTATACIPPEAAPVMADVSREYALTVDAIRAYLDSAQSAVDKQ